MNNIFFFPPHFFSQHAVPWLLCVVFFSVLVLPTFHWFSSLSGQLTVFCPQIVQLFRKAEQEQEQAQFKLMLHGLTEIHLYMRLGVAEKRIPAIILWTGAKDNFAPSLLVNLFSLQCNLYQGIFWTGIELAPSTIFFSFSNFVHPINEFFWVIIHFCVYCSPYLFGLWLVIPVCTLKCFATIPSIFLVQLSRDYVRQFLT